MKGYLGEFEELVLLTIAALDDDAYGTSIKDLIEKRMNRTISLGALHSTLTRLEEKGLASSELGGATNERGGRRKRIFTLTTEGIEALAAYKQLRDELWQEGKLKLRWSHD